MENNNFIKELYNELIEQDKECEYTSQAAALFYMLRGDNVFLSGPAGSGKSYVVRKYIDILKRVKEYSDIKEDIRAISEIAITSTTGLSALNLSDNAKTIHSWTGMNIDKTPFKQKEEYINSKNASYIEKKLWYAALKRGRETRVLIVDEISMLTDVQLDYIYNLVKYNKNFQLIMSGDFNQLPPVKGEYCFGTEAWEKFEFTHCYLDKVYRTSDAELKEILDKIISNKGEEVDLSNIQTVSPDDLDDIDFPILKSTNREVTAINTRRQKNNPNDTHIFRIKYPNSKIYNKEFIERSRKYAKTQNVEEELKLKVDDIVMITMNDTSKATWCYPLTEESPVLRNGMIGRIYKISSGGIFFEYKDRKKNITYKYRIEEQYHYEEVIIKNKKDENGETYQEKEVVSFFYQYPIKLAYAISIHKSQGQTYSEVACDLTRCWAPNLGYVALSRAESIEGIRLIKRKYVENSYDSRAFEINEKSLQFTQDILNLAKKGKEELSQITENDFINLIEYNLK